MGMKLLFSCPSMLLALAAIASCTQGTGKQEDQAAVGTATITNMDSPGRIEGQFYVEFRSPEEIRQLAKSADFKPLILPELVPADRSSAEALAAALAAAAHGKVMKMMISKRASAFSVEGVSDEAMREVIARDPRVRLVEPNARVELLRSQ